MWDVSFQCIAAPEGRDIVVFSCDKAHITFYNLVCLKSKLGYSVRAFMYYKKRCGRDIASLISIDYDHQIEVMIANNQTERELRLVLTMDQQTDLQVSISPMKRPRDTTTEEPIHVPTIEEPIDVYRNRLANLQQDEPDTGKFISSTHHKSHITYLWVLSTYIFIMSRI